MRTVVDTSVWSLALRRQANRLSPLERDLIQVWRWLVTSDEVVTLGPVRQEVLSGVRVPDLFSRLRSAMSEFVDEPLETVDFERAAEMSNACRSRGVQGSTVDFVICSVAERLSAPILTTDRDFERFATVIPVKLHEGRVW